jgi:methylase of polypeptide subunit release factors
VKVTPDDIWIVIMLFFSKYVIDHAEQLREKLVSHEGKKKLSVTTDNEISEKEWDQFFNEIIVQIKKNTKEGVTKMFECNFTSTGRVEKILSTSVIMETYKKYFDYERVIPECGIQKIHLGGELKDWQ